MTLLNSMMRMGMAALTGRLPAVPTVIDLFVIVMHLRFSAGASRVLIV